jgi:hypothetical protein
MKRLILLVCLLLQAGVATAQIRASSVDRPCAASRQDVARNGAIVLGTGGYTYDRFVADRRFCERDEFTEPAFVPSRDTQACFVGYRCRSSSPLWDR